jgi:two-component system chemotaxis response regulator CheY
MKKTILVVDDSSMVRALFRAALGDVEDLQLRQACNGAEAFEAIKQFGEPDVIFIDVNMPVMDGLEFLALAAKTGLQQRVPVVIISTEGREEDVRRGLEAGARAYVRKPFQPQRLLAVVERLTARPGGPGNTRGDQGT